MDIAGIHYADKIGFDYDEYIQTQKNQILEKMGDFFRLYLELEGDPIKNPLAISILPGYPTDASKRIFLPLKDQIDILFCINADDILMDKQMTDENISYAEYLETRLMVIERNLGVKPVLVINNIDVSCMFDLVLNFERRFQKKQYRVFERYKISGYPYNMQNMIGENGFAADDHIPLTHNLVLVVGANSNSGKFSTCLGQIYLDDNIGIKSGYAKLNILPIGDLPLGHPINLAYESENTDLEYSCTMDELCKENNNKDFVIVKKDVDCFNTLKTLVSNLSDQSNWSKYISPSDMITNTAGNAINGENIVKDACIKRIQENIEFFEKQGETENMEKCKNLLNQAKA